VSDLIEAHILALEAMDTYPNGTYNLGNGRGFTNLEVVKTVEMVSGKKVPFECAARRPGDPVELIASSELACQKLGWRPKYTRLEEIVASAWEWHQKHPHGYR
jgi:UDP-glucose 4-epimerase